MGHRAAKASVARRSATQRAGQGQRRGTDVRVARCEIGVAIDKLAENVELPGPGGDV